MIMLLIIIFDKYLKIKLSSLYVPKIVCNNVTEKKKPGFHQLNKKLKTNIKP